MQKLNFFELDALHDLKRAAKYMYFCLHVNNKLLLTLRFVKYVFKACET